MQAMLLTRLASLERDESPLELTEVPDPQPGAGEVVVRVRACGVCHTELDEIEGRTPPPRLPVIPGHQAVGEIEAVGTEVTSRRTGDRVGVAWIYSACGRCGWCQSGQENLCPEFSATGRDHHGGYARYLVVPAEFTVPVPVSLNDVEAAPLLCAGAIGYRSLRLTKLQNGQRLGLTGFGASAHLVLKMVRHRFPQTDLFVFARSEGERRFARELGAVWAGDTLERPPELLHAVIDTTPAWTPIVAALRALLPGGRLVVNAIRKEESDKSALLGLDYAEQLWMEKEIKSVANVTRQDVREFLDLAVACGIRSAVQEFPLREANRALVELKRGAVKGAKVLIID